MADLAVRELPLFPLPDVVLFPQEVLPLHIFESRYRIMLQTVLEADSRFGIVRSNPATKQIADVGCCAQIVKHQTSEDGRSNIVTVGQQRFRILESRKRTEFRHSTYYTPHGRNFTNSVVVKVRANGFVLYTRTESTNHGTSGDTRFAPLSADA